MARAIWSGTISFGLLNVPVKLYSAVSRKTIRFNDLRASDGVRVRNRRVAEGTDEEVPYEEIVKGYEVSPDRYVVMTREELSALDPKKTRSIEIQDFVEIGEIDPIYFENPYYLGPAEGAEKAYSLLARGDGVLRQGGDRPFRPAQPRAPGRDPRLGRGPDDDHDALRRRGRLPGGARGRPAAVEAEDRSARRSRWPRS